MRYLFLLCGLAAAGLPASPSAGQALDPTFAAPTSLYGTGGVLALGPTQADGKRLVSGYFTRVSGTAVTGGLVRLDAAGTLDQAFLQNVGAASAPYRIRGLANGQYLLGGQGNVLTAGGLTRTELLRLNADGTADASFDPGTGPNSVNGYGFSGDFVAQPDGKILVGGYFDEFNGSTAHGVVRLNANGSVDNSFSVGTGADGEVYALAVQADGKILVGGNFPSFNGQYVRGLARLNANGSLDTSFSSALTSSTYVSGLTVQPDGTILVQGYLGINGTYGSTLVRLLPSGSLDPGFTLSPAVSNIYSYATYAEIPTAGQPDGRIVVVGDFDLPGYRRVARLNADGSLDIGFNTPTGPNDPPTAVGLQPDGSLLTGGGNFTSVGSTETALARFASSGAFDAGFAPRLQTSASVTALVRQADGTVLAGGSFTEWDGQPVHRLVRLSATGTLDAGYVASGQPLKGSVSCLLLQADGKALVGTNRGVYRVLASGAPDAGFTFFYPYPTTVSALAQQADGKLLVGGSYAGTVGGAYRRLARLNADGSFDNTFVRAASSLSNPLMPSALLVQADGRVVVASPYISTTTGTTTTYLQRYEPSGAIDNSFAVSSYAYATAGSAGVSLVGVLVQQADGKLLVGGRFSPSASSNRNSLTRLTTTGTLDTDFTGAGLVAGGTVSALAIQPNGQVLVGGSFQATGPAGTYINLARVLPSGQLDATFVPAGARPNGPVSTIAVQPDGGILLQGGFTALTGQARLNLARITAPGVLAVAAPAAVAAATTAWPVPAHEVLHVLPAATAHPLGAELLDALGRVVMQQALAGPGEFSFDTRTLPAGLYVLRLRYAEGSVSRRLAVE